MLSNNCHKSNGLKQCLFISIWFYRLEVMVGFYSQGSMKSKINVSAWLGS